MAQRMIEGGSYDGHPIRRARKDWTCDGRKGWPDARLCNRPIPRGSYYVEGFVNPDVAGGFGHDRLCAECVDEIARAAIAAAKGERGA